MIHKLILKNFKKIKDEILEFNNFDLIVGSNNSGKSTALQSLAIWQYCVDQFKFSPKKGSTGIQIVLPNFTALPVPEFNLLWTNKTIVTREAGSNKNNNISIEIDVYWKDINEAEQHFCVQIRYQSPQTVYAIPKGGWQEFNTMTSTPYFPRIVYVPPFSGLEPTEIKKDDGVLQQHVGKGQPGSVLRNLLFRVVNQNSQEHWEEISKLIKEWFNVDLLKPQWEEGRIINILAEYKSSGKTFDIISGGSGFHQILTLLAFLYGYDGITTVLFDEPDAHLHVNLQRKVIQFLQHKTDIQFLIATHSEEFVKGVDIASVLSVMSGKPTRVHNSGHILNALSMVDNIDIIRTQDSPFIIYVEGEDDDRIISSWANRLNKSTLYNLYYTKIMNGGSKVSMKKLSDTHFSALKEVNPLIQRMMILDYDDENSFHPDPDNKVIFEWKRKNIDNYLLVPSAWKRAVSNLLNEAEESLFLQPYYTIIDNFFIEQNLTLPPNKSWNNVSANIFAIVDGKKILFENKDSLFNRLHQINSDIKVNRAAVASAMIQEEIHNDIIELFAKLEKESSNQ